MESPLRSRSRVSVREADGSAWIITGYGKGGGPTIAEGIRNIGSQQTAFDAEPAAIQQAISWFLGRGPEWQHMATHSDSTSAIARVGHTGAGGCLQHPENGSRTAG
jgi:hypothetical protein